MHGRLYDLSIANNRAEHEPGHELSAEQVPSLCLKPDRFSPDIFPRLLPTACCPLRTAPPMSKQDVLQYTGYCLLLSTCVELTLLLCLSSQHVDICSATSRTSTIRKCQAPTEAVAVPFTACPVRAAPA